MSRKRASTDSTDDDLNRILSSAYVEKASGKKDLLRRLRNVVRALSNDNDDEEDDDEALDPSEYPGLDGLAQTLVAKKYLEHKDKEVRLYTVLCCVEIFYLYAPEPPWDPQEILAVFSQMIRQLSNLAHCTSASQSNFSHYFHLLDQLASVKIGVVLVELTRTLDEDDQKEPLELLCDLIRTILNLVHIDHPPDVTTNAVTAVAACIEEFDSNLPIPVLDELLQVVSVGPVVLVTNPAAVEAAAKNAKSKNNKTKDKMPPMQIQQKNPPYMAAAAVIRRTVDRISTPMASFLNGLWNQDPNIVAQTSISPESQSAIIYELHKISPQILTTVIGTVTNSLQAPQAEQRLEVVKLLGRLFYSKSSRIGTQFRPCFREWLRRSTDIDLGVRESMVKYLVTVLSSQPELAQDTSLVLEKMIDQDPSADVRIPAIHKVCDLAYKTPSLVSARLLRAVGNRVSSKTKTERRDALTGLAQIYHRHYICQRLQQVQNGGDDCEIGIILDAFKVDEDLEDKYGWIAQKVFESACFTDDYEMRNRVVQIVDDVLLGQQGSLTGTSRSVGFAIVMESLQDTNASSWMKKLFSQRARLQRALEEYLDARDRLRQAKSGSEKALRANAQAMERLEIVNTLTAPGNEEVLEKLHAARDNHIFRILATIVSPHHSTKARSRAFDDLPKRTKALGDNTAVWVKTLARRCAMGFMVNLEVAHNSILLAQECFNEGDGDVCVKFLSCLQIIADTYPSLCGKKQDFGTLLEFFSECREVQDYQSKKVMENLGILTKLSSILATVAPTLKDRGDIDADLQSQFLNLCTRDGTPEQARHAVKTMAALLSPKGDKKSAKTTDKLEEEAFGSLLKDLTSPSRLRLDVQADKSKIVSVLTALAALAESAPSLFASGRGKRAVSFALDTFLLGHSAGGGEESENDEDDDKISGVDETPSKSRRQSKAKKSPGKVRSPRGVGNALEDTSLSIVCRRLCATIDFLVSHIRASVLFALKTKSSTVAPSHDHIAQVFGLLHQILRDKGLPPSSRDRRDCRSRQDRSALREFAAISLFRLSDVRLKLERKYLSPLMWHTLASSLLDEEQAVRSSVMEELNAMLTGQDKYRPEGSATGAFAPSLRFVAMVTLCCDADHGVGNVAANGNAANVGKLSVATKTASMKCIATLRRTCDATLHQCRALGKQAELNFERSLKMMIMPEYSVPYAIHLLSLRRETPAAGGTAAGVPGLTQYQQAASEDDDFMGVDEEAQQKVLRKRLKWLFEPLILSLGDGANNISFLMRLCEMLGSSFQPVDVLAASSSTIDLKFPSQDDDSLASPVAVKNTDTHNLALLVGKLKTTCVAAREVLMSYVKKDINLSPYPGQIQLPMTLFKKLAVTFPKKSSLTTPNSQALERSLKRKSVATPKSTRRSKQNLASRFDAASDNDQEETKQPAKKSRVSKSSIKSPTARRSPRRTRASVASTVHFSPDVDEQKVGKTRSSRARGEDGGVPDDASFGDMSPIARSASPSFIEDDDPDTPDTGTKTAGTTPPSGLKTAPSSGDEDESVASEPNGVSSQSTNGTRKAAVRLWQQSATDSERESLGLSTQNSESDIVPATRGRRRRSNRTSASSNAEGRDSLEPSPADSNLSSQISASDDAQETKRGRRRSKRRSTNSDAEGRDSLEPSPADSNHSSQTTASDDAQETKRGRRRSKRRSASSDTEGRDSLEPSPADSNLSSQTSASDDAQETKRGRRRSKRRSASSDTEGRDSLEPSPASTQTSESDDAPVTRESKRRSKRRSTSSDADRRDSLEQSHLSTHMQTLESDDAPVTKASKRRSNRRSASSDVAIVRGSRDRHTPQSSASTEVTQSPASSKNGDDDDDDDDADDESSLEPTPVGKPVRQRALRAKAHKATTKKTSEKPQKEERRSSSRRRTGGRKDSLSDDEAEDVHNKENHVKAGKRGHEATSERRKGKERRSKKRKIQPETPTRPRRNTNGVSSSRRRSPRAKG